MPGPGVMIIEDDEDLQELLQFNLRKEGYSATGVLTGEDGLKAAFASAPAIIILDLMLPGINGLDVCRRLKSDPRTKDVPIVILTAKGEESDVVAGLELGADDYVAKPFSVKVLLARLRAVLRRRDRAVPDGSAVLEAGGMTIHPGRHEVLVNGEAAPLTATEFRLLHLLARRPGWVFTRYQIVDGVHGEDCAVTDRSVDVQIVGLRRKLGRAGDRIETVRGVGYRFRE